MFVHSIIHLSFICSFFFFFSCHVCIALPKILICNTTTNNNRHCAGKTKQKETTLYVTMQCGVMRTAPFWLLAWVYKNKLIRVFVVVCKLNDIREEQYIKKQSCRHAVWSALKPFKCTSPQMYNFKRCTPTESPTPLQTTCAHACSKLNKELHLWWFWLNIYNLLLTLH